eukprot:TRINITY_DN14873_c0_g1_i2.p1 TRINITY_DN14873_c0_g1~~TRINITY_DN14873_c0_g1_i2.p1  ORF type:complete len:439 (+),score=83.85 TRINITY_DN14873_c0_g1_i2:72-1388(+)
MCDPLAYTPSPRQHASPAFDAFSYKQNDDEIAKLRGVVKALNEVVNARKNEAEALQQQLDGVSQDYEILFREKEAADREIERLKELAMESNGVNVINAMSGTARGSSYSRQTAVSNPPSLAHSSHSPISHQSAPRVSAPPSTSVPKTTTGHPQQQSDLAARLKHVAALFAFLLIINGPIGYYLLPSTNTSNQVPKHIALATKGGDLSSSITYSDVISDSLFNATVDHITNNLGGPALLLGELVEIGIVLQPLKAWRAVATVCKGLDSGFPNSARSEEEADSIIYNTCWSCKDSVSIPSSIPSLIFNTLIAIEVIVIIAVISKRLAAALPGTPPTAAEEDSLRDKFPILMFRSEVTESINTAFISTKEGTNDYEITLLLNGEKGFINTLLDAVVGVEQNRFLQIEIKADKSVNLVSSASGKQSWNTTNPIPASALLNSQ